MLEPARLAVNREALRLFELYSSRDYLPLINAIGNIDWSLDPLLYRNGGKLVERLMAGILGDIISPYQCISISCIPFPVTEPLLEALQSRRIFYHIDNSTVKLDGASEILGRLNAPPTSSLVKE